MALIGFAELLHRFSTLPLCQQVAVCQPLRCAAGYGVSAGFGFLSTGREQSIQDAHAEL